MLKLFRIDGYSLYPLFKEGELVLARKLFFFNKIELNDFVVFIHKKEGLMIKRVVSIENDRYFVKGENSDSIDSRNFGLIHRSELLYKVILKIKDY